MLTPLALDLIWAFDPGESTGAICVNNGKVMMSSTFGYDQFMNELVSTRFSNVNMLGITLFAANRWVVEQFYLYPWKAAKMGFDGMIPVRVIGALELRSRIDNIPIEFQTAQVAKQFSTDKRLKEYGWWPELHTKHERDAARHALYYLAIRQQQRKQQEKTNA